MASRAMPNHVLQHRLVMSRQLGRPLVSSEVVHHINGRRYDNRPENLVLITASEHVANHNKERVHTEQSKEKHRKQIKSFIRDKYGKIIKQ